MPLNILFSALFGLIAGLATSKFRYVIGLALTFIFFDVIWVVLSR